MGDKQHSENRGSETKKTVFRKTDDPLFKARMTNTSNYAKNDCCLSSLLWFCG